MGGGGQVPCLPPSGSAHVRFGCNTIIELVASKKYKFACAAIKIRSVCASLQSDKCLQWALYG